MANVLVFGERRDGKVKRPTLEALGQARRLAGDGRVEVVVFGPGAGEAAGELAVAALEDLYATVR